MEGISRSNLVQNLLGNKRSNTYERLVNNLMEEYKAMGCCMSLKMHFLHSQLDFLVQIWVM